MVTAPFSDLSEIHLLGASKASPVYMQHLAPKAEPRKPVTSMFASVAQPQTIYVHVCINCTAINYLRACLHQLHSHKLFTCIFASVAQPQTIYVHVCISCTAINYFTCMFASVAQPQTILRACLHQLHSHKLFYVHVCISCTATNVCVGSSTSPIYTHRPS